MKKLIIAMLVIVMVSSASAQKVAVSYRPVNTAAFVRPHTTIIRTGFYPYYRPYYFGYNPYFATAPYYRYESRPTKLDLQIEDINNDYDDKIWSVRHNDQLSGKERRKQIHDLKHERDAAITDAKKNYYVK